MPNATHIAQHAQTLANQGSFSAPPPIDASVAAFEVSDFSVIDLATGGAAAVTVHRVPGLLPERHSRLEYRTGPTAIGELSQPVGPGTTVIEGLNDGVVTQISIRLVSFDEATGAEVFGAWSPAQAVTTTRYEAHNFVSDTTDPPASTAGRWTATWAGAIDGGGYARFTSASASQAIIETARALVAAGPVTMLAIVELRSDGAATSTLRVTGTPAAGAAIDVAARVTWADGAVAVTASAGATGVSATRVDWDAGAGTARLALVATLPDGAADALSIAVEGADTAFRGIDLRRWSAGDTAWPEAEPVATHSLVARTVAPAVTPFDGATLEATEADPRTLPFTVFGSEVADSTTASVRTNALSGASVTAGGSGYADGTHVLAASGGEGGTVSVTVSGGAVTGAVVATAGRNYQVDPALDLSAIPGGSGAAVAVSRAQVARDFWPAVNDGVTRATWSDKALGEGAFVVEGFLGEGGFHAAGTAHELPSGLTVEVTEDGNWRVDQGGARDIDAEDEGERRVFGLVLTNGGKRTVMDLPVGLAGAQPRRMRIIGMPAIHGSGRWGDSLTAMPGRIAEGDTGSATVSYTWFRNGQPIEGETDFRLRLVPSVAALGDAISVSVAWSDGATQESWETPAVTVKTWKHVDDGGVIRFGALTPAGLFGVPVATDEVTITSGNGAGHWELRTGGGVAFLRPTAGPSTPGSDPVTSGESVISGTYTLGLSNGDTLTVTVIPGVYTALLKRDIEVLAQDLGAPAGSGQYAFDFSSGGRIELWNSGIWGHVDDPASAGTRITELVLNGSDADGGPGALVVAPYDAAEPTVVTGPVHIAEARNLSWQVDLAHAPALDDTGSIFAGGRLMAIDRLGRTVAIEDCRVRGPGHMRERLARAIEPAGVLLGAGATPLVPGQTPVLALRGVAVADIGTVMAHDLGAVEVSDCRVERCGARPFALAAGPDTTASASVTLQRSLFSDPLGIDAWRAGAWVTVTPSGMTGFAPTYRPGIAVTVEDCVMLPGQAMSAAMAGVVLARDASLGDGSAEDDFGVVFTPFSLERTLILTGLDAGVALSSGEAGAILDASVLQDARGAGLGILGGAGRPAVTHDNGFRPLGTGFTVNDSAAGALVLGGGTGGVGGTVLAAADALAALGATDAAGLAPRVLAAALDGFRPEAEGALDPDGTGAVAGAIAGDGTFKGDLSALPAVQPLPWGIATWGLDRMVSGIGWGAIPEQADTAFKVQPTRLSGPAPMAVHVQLKGIDRDERLVDDVLWDFEEDYEYDVLPLESRARRTSRYGSGYVSGHVYRTPGTYTITATHRTRLGHERSTSIAVTALDPDTVYPGADTVCVSTLGDFTGAPAGALQAASVAEVIALRPGTSGPRRVLFRRGEEIYLSDSFSQRTNDYFGAFGPVEDGKPHLRRDANSAGAGHFRSGGGADIIVTGLEMSDSYDAADPVPASEHPEQAVLYTGYSAVNSHTRSTITDCTMRGMRIMVQLSFSTAISNCYFTDWYDYGCLGTAVKTLIIGNRIAQNPDAADFLDGKTANSGVTPNGADHGPVRCGRTEQTVVANNHLESWNGWTIGIAADGSSRSVHQPCLRLLVTNTPTARESAVVTGNHLVGGITQLAVQQNSAPTQPLVPNTGTLIDGNFFENNGNVARAIQLAYPTSAVRNNIFHSRDIADNIANGISSFAVLFASDTSAEGLASRRDVVSNTVLLETAKPDKTFEISRNSGTPYPALDQRNNAVSVAGYGNAGDFPAIAPLDNFHPAPGSALVDGAIGTAPVRDYRLSLRDAVASTGALAPFTAREIDVTAGGGVPLAGAVTTGGMLTLAARVARDGSGTRQVLGVGGDGLELLSPSGRMRLALRLDDGSVLVDTTLDGLAAEGAFVSVMLAVDLAGGLTGGRTVSLWVDGAEVYSQPVAARPALADLSGAVLMGGTAAARLAQWLWLDGTVALDPATQWDAFFDAAGAPRNLEPAGRVSLVPEVFLNAMPERFGLPLNRGRGGALAIPQGYVPA